MTECSPSVPPALCRLLCPLPSPVIISAWLLLSFPLRCLSHAELCFPAPAALPTAAETPSSGRAQDSEQPGMLMQGWNSSQLRGLFLRSNLNSSVIEL